MASLFPRLRPHFCSPACIAAPEFLESLYDEIIRTAIFTVKPDHIATFLGQRILGTRIKHHMSDISIKMYDKFGRVLRIGCTCNDIGTFQVEREVSHRDSSISIQKAPLKKRVYSLYQLFTSLKAANYRYLEFISSFDDHSSRRQKLDEISPPAEREGMHLPRIQLF